MHRPPGNVCCRFFNSPAPSHRTPLWFRSNSARSTTACSIEAWSSYVTASIRRHLACPMDAASRSPSGPLEAFLLRRKRENYRDALISHELDGMEADDITSVDDCTCYAKLSLQGAR